MFGSGSVLKYMIRYFLVPHLLSFLGGTLGISGYIGTPLGHIFKSEKIANTQSHLGITKTSGLPKISGNSWHFG